MTKVIADQSVSLDGFSAGANVREGNGLGDKGDSLHTWMDTYGSGFEQVQSELFESGGAVIMGRTVFDVGFKPWGENPPFHMPVFVLTHRSGQPVEMEGGTTYFFVTGGVANVLNQAKTAADGKDVIVIGGADIIQQFIDLGLVDELRIHLAHVLLGDGKPFFRRSNADHVELETMKVVESPGATHITFRVKRKDGYP